MKIIIIMFLLLLLLLCAWVWLAWMHWRANVEESHIKYTHLASRCLTLISLLLMLCRCCCCYFCYQLNALHSLCVCYIKNFYLILCTQQNIERCEAVLILLKFKTSELKWHTGKTRDTHTRNTLFIIFMIIILSFFIAEKSLYYFTLL